MKDGVNMELLRSFKKYRYLYIFAIMSFAAIFSNFHQIGLSTVSGEVANTLNIGPFGLASLVAAFLYPYALMQIPVGILADTVGARKTTTITLLIACVGTFLFASTTNLYIAILGRICIGIGVSAIMIPMLKLLSVWFSPHLFGHLTAITFSIGTLGFFAATSPISYASAAIGWQNVFLIIGCMTFILAILVYIIVRDRKDDHVKAPTKDFNFAQFKEIFWHVVSNKKAWCLGIYYLCQFGMYYAFIGLWAGQYLEKGIGMTREETGLVLTLPAVALIIGPVFTFLSNKLTPYKVLFLLSAITFIGSIPLVLGLPHMKPYFFSAYFFMLSLGGVGGAAIIFDLVTRIFPPRYVGTASGFINVFPFLGGAICQQSIGYIVEKTLLHSDSFLASISYGFIVFPITGFISLTVLILLRKNAPLLMCETSSRI